MKIRLAGIIENSINNGEGIRKVIFAQGCKHHCKGCFNPSTHDFNGGYECDTDKIIERINNDYMIDGVTFSGGDPFEQAEAFAEIAKNINPELNIWCYTGYTLQEIIDKANEKPEWVDLLTHIDVLVDGKFEEDKKDRNLKFKGSSNQNIIQLR
jgi:anaerobic ribonucleoside-triphosphate reductase activating protein